MGDSISQSPFETVNIIGEPIIIEPVYSETIHTCRYWYILYVIFLIKLMTEMICNIVYIISIFKIE